MSSEYTIGDRFIPYDTLKDVVKCNWVAVLEDTSIRDKAIMTFGLDNWIWHYLSTIILSVDLATISQQKWDTLEQNEGAAPIDYHTEHAYDVDVQLPQWEKTVTSSRDAVVFEVDDKLSNL